MGRVDFQRATAAVPAGTYFTDGRHLWRLLQVSEEGVYAEDCQTDCLRRWERRAFNALHLRVVEPG